MLKPTEINRLLIIKPRGTGDVVLSTVMLKNLRKYFNHAKIDYLTDPVNHQVLDGLSGIDQVLGFNIRKEGTIKTVRLIRKNRYDLVIDLYCNPRTALITFLSGAKYRAGFNFKKRMYAYNIIADNHDGKLSSIDYYLEMLKTLSVPVISTSTEFPKHKANTELLDNFFAPFEGKLKVGLLMAGGWASKKFPAKRLALLGQLIRKKWNAEIFVGHGPLENADFEEFKSAANYPFHKIPDKTFTDVGYSASKLDIVIVNDSGPMHVATAAGGQVIGIFGPTNPRQWAPHGENSQWIRHEELDCIACDLLDCPKPDHPCMNGLDLNRIINLTETVLRKHNKLK